MVNSHFEFNNYKQCLSETLFYNYLPIIVISSDHDNTDQNNHGFNININEH